MSVEPCNIVTYSSRHTNKASVDTGCTWWMVARPGDDNLENEVCGWSW